MLYPWEVQSRIHCQKSSAHKQGPIVCTIACMCACVCVHVCVYICHWICRAVFYWLYLFTCPSFFSGLMCNESASNHLLGHRQGFLWTMVNEPPIQPCYIWSHKNKNIHCFKNGLNYHLTFWLVEHLPEAHWWSDLCPAPLPGLVPSRQHHLLKKFTNDALKVHVKKQPDVTDQNLIHLGICNSRDTFQETIWLTTDTEYDCCQVDTEHNEIQCALMVLNLITSPGNCCCLVCWI